MRTFYAPHGKNKMKRNKRVLYKNNKAAIWDKKRLITELLCSSAVSHDIPRN
jgi:hypothetical protein